MKVEAAIKECRFADADKSIAQMASCPERARLESKLAEARDWAIRYIKPTGEGAKALFERGRLRRQRGEV